MTEKCTYEGCNEDQYARTFCKPHYHKLRYKGFLKKREKHIDAGCLVDGCDKPHSAKGRCQKHYREFKVSQNPRIYKDVEVRRVEAARKRKAYFVKLMGGKCVICGYDKNPACFDFHHIDPSEKEYEPAKLMRKPDMDKILKEISKCMLLCKNCHNDLHHPMTPDIPDEVIEESAP